MLEREQAAVDAEFVRNEFEKVSREVETAFTDKARVVAEFFGAKVDEVFGAENGHLAKELAAAVRRRLHCRRPSAQLRQVMLKQIQQQRCTRTCSAVSRRPTKTTLGRLRGRH